MYVDRAKELAEDLLKEKMKQDLQVFAYAYLMDVWNKKLEPEWDADNNKESL